ncbi:MAG: hypothetical protein H7255_15250 [Ramlibacter sp.]|nr:hypothetical protein [Ramlibacter sp.]
MEALVATVTTAIRACGECEKRVGIDVLVNGNSQLAGTLARTLTRQDIAKKQPTLGIAVRVWSIQFGDKANAWNEYIRIIWSGEEIAFFIDGYVQLLPDSIRLLGPSVAGDSTRLGGTGVPMIGKSATLIREEMIRNGGFHGNFCCIKSQSLFEMKARQIRIPIGMYRTDSLMGAILNFDLDPEKNEWNPERILVHPAATWEVKRKNWWSWADQKGAFKRLLRQARGSLENQAVKRLFTERRQLPERLPGTVRQLLAEWWAAQPRKSGCARYRHPLSYWAWRDSQKPSPATPTSTSAQLVASLYVR